MSQGRWYSTERAVAPAGASSNLRGIDRRQFLQATGLAGAFAAGGSLLAACSSAASSAPTVAAVGKPRRGGTLNVGILGGSSADTLDGDNPLSAIDHARVKSLFNQLAVLDKNANMQLELAESIEPNSNNTAYTIRLKSGITFHDGRPLTIDDVIFSLTRIVKSQFPDAPGLAALDTKNIKKLDGLTARFTLKSPSAVFLAALAGNECQIVPVGFNPRKPVGTGAFKYSSFTPGQQSVFTRNGNYFKAGLPYLDELVLVDSPDVTARLNALLGGQLDVIDQVPIGQIPTIKGNSAFRMYNSPTGYCITTYMRCDQAPFNDNRVRQAMKLIIDRPQMLDVAGGTFGTLGNDIFGKFFPDYDSSLAQREQNVDQAKSLLRQAGQQDLTVQLVTADVATGMVEQAQVLSQQAQAAGVTIKVNEVTSAQIYGSNFLNWEFSQDYWYGKDYLYQMSLNTITGASDDEDHFNSPAFDALYAQANRTADPAKRAKIIAEMQTIDYNEGGYLIPYYSNIVDAFSSKVGGLQPAGKVGLPLGSYDFETAYFA
jgi:peptide/nickel transport system substrate-binding protein